jgi:nucleotide-binding universal stress UspA family protein
VVKGILVGLDGSPFSDSAVELGIRWAKRHDAMLVGLGIVDEPGIRGGEPVPLGGGSFKRQRDEALLADARHRVDRFLQRFSLQCAQAGVACKVLEDVGLPAQEIVIEAQRYDVILLGRRTYFHFETEEGPDDTVQRVVKDSPRPVVTVPNSSLRGGQGVLVAYDGSLQAARAVQAFQASQLQEGDAVTVASIGPAHAQAARVADRAVDFLRSHGVPAEPLPVVTDAPPDEALLEQVRKLHPVMVVMGAYGQPTWREFLLGSVTRTMLKLSPAPLFLYH